MARRRAPDSCVLSVSLRVWRARPRLPGLQRRRGARGRRSHRHVVGDRTVRRRARHHDVREGDLRRIRRPVGDCRGAARRRYDRGGIGQLRSRANLLASPRRVRGRRGHDALSQEAQTGRAVRADGARAPRPDSASRRLAACRWRARPPRRHRVRRRQVEPLAVPAVAEVCGAIRRCGARRRAHGVAERRTCRRSEWRSGDGRSAVHYYGTGNRRDRGPIHHGARENDREPQRARVTADRDYPRIVVPPPGPKARAIVERQDRFASTSYPKEYPLAVARGQGPMVEDVDGNRFLDFMAGIAVASTGYGHPKVVKAVQDAAARFLHICGSDFYYESFAALCERLAQLAPGPSKKRVFLANSGTEAVEGAIKLARHSTGRPAIIGFLGAFHGRSYGGLSLTASKAVQRSGFAPFLPEVHHVPYGYRYRCEYCRGESACTRRCTSWIEEELFTKKVSPDSVAAIFVEPIQGEGGYVVPPPGYLKALREMCDRYGILLVCDEVQCGIGRTGQMFATEYEGIEPDILLSAKGLGSGMPIGAIIAKESIMKWKPGAHGTTFGGNPVCCAAALATLDIVEQELLPNVAKMGDRLITGARKLQDNYSAIGDVG